MAHRSPTNDRYRGESKGQTRKSAGSLKPKRPAGTMDTSRPEPAGKSKPAAKPKRSYTPLPTTPLIQKWRRIWWVLIILAFGGFALYFVGAKQNSRTIEIVGLVVELVGVLVAVNIDIFVIRKLRKEAAQAALGGKGKHARMVAKADSSEKAGGKDAS